MSTENPYEILELPLEASVEDVKKQYKTLIRQYSPERDPEMFSTIRTAYDAINSELFVEQKKLKRYRKPLELCGTDKAAAKTDNRPLLKTVFETPFNTVFELEKLLDAIKI
jgi:curved DNA-binding protein CbpA